MANEFGGAKEGLMAMLRRIDGLRVLDYTAQAVNQFPAAIVRPESREALETLSGGAVRGCISVEMLVDGAHAAQTSAALDAFLEPTGARSIEAAVHADPTWGGKVDDGRLVSVDNIGARKRNGARCIGADFHFRFIKSVRG